MKILNIRIRPRMVFAEIGGVPSGEEAAAFLVSVLARIGIVPSFNSGIATVAAVRVDVKVHEETGPEVFFMALSVVVGAMACWGTSNGFAVRVDEELGMDEGWKLCQENGEVVWRPDP